MKQITKYIVEKQKFLVKKHVSQKKDELTIEDIIDICKCEDDELTDSIDSCSVVSGEYTFDGSMHVSTILVIYINDFDLDPDFLIVGWDGHGEQITNGLEAIRDYINKGKKHDIEFTQKANNGPLLEYNDGYNNITRYRIIPKGQYAKFNIVKRL